MSAYALHLITKANFGEMIMMEYIPYLNGCFSITKNILLNVYSISDSYLNLQLAQSFRMN